MAKITIGFWWAVMVYAPSAFFGRRVGPSQRFDNFKRFKVFMSQHRSLRAAATLGGKRNVLKRFERTELLKKRGQWKDGDRITGLRKTKPEA